MGRVGPREGSGVAKSSVSELGLNDGGYSDHGGKLAPACSLQGESLGRPLGQVCP